MATFGRGAEPWVFSAGDPPTALLPLVFSQHRGVRALRILGHGVSDYLGCVPLEAPATIWHSLGEALRAEAASFDLLDLESLHADDEQRRALVQGLGLHCAERLYERCPVIDTCGGWDAYLESRKKKFRANLKRAARRVAEHGEPLAARESLTPALFEDLVKLERESWKWAAKSAFLSDDASRRFLATVLLDDPVPHELWTLRLGAALAAFAVVLRAGDVRHYYLPSFCERYPDAGTHLLAAIVKDSFEGPVREFDFLRGDESYKLACANRERAVHQLVAAGRTALGPIALTAMRARWRLARSHRVRRLREAVLTWKRGPSLD